MDYVQILVKLLVGGAWALLIIRLMGKKAISDLTPFDMLFTVIMGAAVSEPVYDSSVSIWQIIFAISMWGVMIYALETFLQRTDNKSKIIEGEPDLLIDQGRIRIDALEKNKLKMEQVRKLLRKAGYYSTEDVYYALLEVDGDITVLGYDEKDKFSVMIIDEGQVDEDVLDSVYGKKKDWVLDELQDKGYRLDEIYFGEMRANGELFLVTYDELIHDQEQAEKKIDE